MNRWIVSACVLPTALTAAAAEARQDLVIPPVDYPTWPRTAPRVEGFAVAGWKVEQVARGDINADGIDDLAFVLRDQDPANILTHDGFGESPFDSNPRILGIALGDGTGFTLVAQDHGLILRRDNPSMDDPFDGIEIGGGSLKVRLQLFMSAGGWSTGPYTFTLRHQDGAVRLIGYDHTNAQRNTGEVTEVSVNFLNGRRSDGTGMIDSDQMRTVWSRTPVGALPLDQVGDGFLFEYETLSPPEGP
jgi:hypothetical protein